MADSMELVRESIMRDMSEGVMTIGFDGVIRYLNPAAGRILDRDPRELTGKNFGRCFFDYEENDAFTQTFLEAVYDRARPHEFFVPYFTGKATRQLHVVTSFLRAGEEPIGVIAVLGDISELTELRDAVKAMERIRALNEKLELRNKLLSETFGRFLSDEIVRQLLDTPDGLALGGKKRTVTMMMSDLRGFTAMSERMDPDHLITMLNHYLEEMTAVIEQYGGTIIEFIGDGIMALFGAPAFSDRHASDAVATALGMQARMESINRWNAERGFPELEMGIGLNTGEVIVGNIGSLRRTKYGVVGSDVNLCGRIESYTVGGQVLISPRTRAAVREELDVAQELTVFPKGVDGALVLSQVTGIGAPYHIYCTDREICTAPLDRPIPVNFHLLDGKHGGSGVFPGTLTALGDLGALLETQVPLAVFDNIQLETDGKLFCKVIRQEDTGLLLRFTSIPEGYARWLKSRKKP